MERSNDILTHDEPAKHKKSMPAGIHEELVAWTERNCYKRKLRQQARDISDALWAVKCKSEKKQQRIKKTCEGPHYSCEIRRQGSNVSHAYLTAQRQGPLRLIAGHVQ